MARRIQANTTNTNKYNLYLPSAVFITQVLVEQLKQIIQNEHNIVENAIWPKTNQLAIYKHGRGFELGASEKQVQAPVVQKPINANPGLNRPHSRSKFIRRLNSVPRSLISTIQGLN